MGFRCPGCGKDFGLDRKAFHDHLEYESGACAGYVHAIRLGIERRCGCLTHESETKKVSDRVRKSYTCISPTHHWVKQNVISDRDGCDIVVCSRCGIKAKRCMDVYKFDMRQSIRKIENCTNNK